MPQSSTPQIAENYPHPEHNLKWNFGRAMMKNYGRVPDEVERAIANLSGMCPVCTTPIPLPLPLWEASIDLAI
jgi:hypothetical protein